MISTARHPRRFAASLGLAAALTAAAGGRAAPFNPLDLPPKTVAPVTVYPANTPPPKIVSSFPGAGETVAPGALVMRITFDQKMDADGFSFSAAGPGGQMPNCLKTPRLLNDEKTFVLLCTTAPETRYAIAFNAAGKGFKNIAGAPLPAAQLAFATNNEDGPRDLDSALKISKLTEQDVPIATQP